MEVDPPENIQIHALQRRICELEQKRTEDKAVIKHLREENVNLRLASQGSNETRAVDQGMLQLEELARVKQELGKANSLVVKLLGQVEESTQEISELRMKASEHDKIVEKNDELQQKNANLEEELVKVKQSVEYVAGQDLRKQLEASKQENVGLKDAKEAAESELVKLDQKIKKIVDLNSDWCKKLEEAKQEILDLKKEAAFQIETQTRRFNEILRALDPSNTLRNDLAYSLFDQSLLELDDEQYEEALELLSKEIMVEESGSNDAGCLAISWNFISFCWRMLSSYGKALEAAEKAIKYSPTNAIYFFTRGMAHKGLNNKDEAISDFKKSLELEPDHECTEAAKTELTELEVEQLP